ncbi:MAG: hemerythrin [Gammaproteobacteria bacterium]|nr:MAG: hemerythrin [Gammaproteobacteria bacterium]
MLIEDRDLDRVGIEAIDRQHRAIAALVNELHRAMEEGRGREALKKILEDLIDTTRAHFAYEEKLMADFHYPGIIRHKNEHRRLLRHIIELHRRFVEGELLLSFAILLDLHAWATRHIAKSDKSLGEFLIRKGVR